MKPPSTAIDSHGARRDLVVLACLVVGFFVVAAHVELSERIARLASSYERWQLDELPLTLVVLSAGLAWFGWRRLGELRRAMAARRLVEQENSAMLLRNRTLAQQLFQLQEQERATLARELHDEFGQCCVAIRVDAATILKETGSQPGAAPQSAQAIIATAEHLHAVVRGMLHRLRPTGLEELGLVTCLRLMIEAWSRRHGVRCALVVEDEIADLTEATAMALYRTVQEALTNIAQHARASEAEVRIRTIPSIRSGAAAEQIALCITDDGQGMPAHGRALGLGILGMQERIGALGGRLSIASGAQGGTLVEVEVPLARSRNVTP